MASKGTKLSDVVVVRDGQGNKMQVVPAGQKSTGPSTAPTKWIKPAIPNGPQKGK